MLSYWSRIRCNTYDNYLCKDLHTHLILHAAAILWLFMTSPYVHWHFTSVTQTLSDSTETDLIPEKVYWSIIIHQQAEGCQIFPTGHLVANSDLLLACVLCPSFKYGNISSRKVNKKDQANLEKVKDISPPHPYNITREQTTQWRDIWKTELVNDLECSEI